MLYICRKKINILKYFIVVLVSTLSMQTTHAQMEINLADHDYKPYYFGITLGGNLNRFHTSLHSRFLEYDSVLVAEPLNAAGFSLGLSATARLTERFEGRFNPQLLFTERNLFYRLKYPDNFENSDSITKKVESVIVTLPLQVKFNSDRIGNFRVYMLGGVKMDIDLASNAQARKADDLVKIQKYDFGIEAGVGLNMYFPSFILSPEIKISNGLNNIHSRDANLKYSNVFDRMQSRMIMFSIHLEG